VIPWGDEEALATFAKETDSDIIVAGHTHSARISKLDKKTFLNPGSITGAYGPFGSQVDASFIILELMGSELGVYQFTLVNQELLVEKAVINK
jgi:vacuolar protein sorting-associated protein 29